MSIIRYSSKLALLGDIFHLFYNNFISYLFHPLSDHIYPGRLCEGGLVHVNRREAGHTLDKVSSPLQGNTGLAGSVET